MSDSSRNVAPAIDPKNTPVTSPGHLEDNLQANNPSSDMVEIPGTKVFQNAPLGDRNSTDICVNLDHSKFSIEGGVAAPNAATTANTTPVFDRSFGPDRSQSPFDSNEGMLSKHHPVSKKTAQKPTLTVAEAWDLGVTHGTDDLKFVDAALHCDTCGYYQAPPRIVIGDSAYVNRMKYSDRYFGFEFILSFVYLVAHVSHLEPPKSRNPFLQVITYENQRLVKDDVVTVPHRHQTIVGVFYTSLHYAIAEVEMSSRTITIYDGLFYDLSVWYQNVVQLLRKCSLIEFSAVAGDLIPDPMSKLICPGHRRGKDVVNGFDLIVDSAKWRLIRGNFIVQSDGFNCGPIACLKVMELFSRLDESEAVDCYAKARIRYVVFEEWHKMITHLDKLGCLKVIDTREEVPRPVNKDNSDSDACSESSDVLAFMSDFDAHIGDEDRNGLLFRPNCTSLCMTRQDSGASPCRLGHELVVHTQLTTVGTYVLFPSMCYHRGYYITHKGVKMTFLTAQLFASFGEKRYSRKKWNQRKDFYQQQQMLPEVLDDLRKDLHGYWDDRYPATTYPPSRMYKNEKIDTQSNRVIHRDDFDRLRNVRNLVDYFEEKYPELQMDIVWFIKKSQIGDGFQRWHQDLNGNGTVVATIVLNIDAAITEDPDSSTTDASDSADTDALYQFFDAREKNTPRSTPSFQLGEQQIQKKEHTPRSPPLFPVGRQEAQEKEHTPRSPPLFHVEQQESFAAAAHTVAYQTKYGTASPTEIDTTRPADTKLMSDMEIRHKSNEDDVTLQVELMPISENITPLKSNVNTTAQNTGAFNPVVPRDTQTPLKINVNTQPQNTGAFVPLLPPLQMPVVIAEANHNTWVCHGCDEEVKNAKKRCKCGCWKGGVRGPTKKHTNTEVKKVKKVPKYKKTVQSKAGQKQGSQLPLDVVEAEAPEGMVVDGGVPTWSPLTGNTGVLDDDATDNDESIHSLSTGARQRESDVDVVVLLNQQDEIEVGDGGDSDIDGDGENVVQSFIDSMVEVELEREKGYIIEREVECDDNTAVEGDTTMVSNDDKPQLWGAPPNWIPPQVPPNWRPSSPNIELGEPSFDKVDNPGGWSSYTYQPVFSKDKKKYLYHAMPSGATVVPKDAVTGKRERNGYEFFYNGWQHPFPDVTNHRNGATKDNLFPEDREVILDRDYLRKMGLTKKRMMECDALFFYQLLLPIVDGEESGIPDDGRLGFYETVAKMTNLYAIIKKDRGGTRGHKFSACTAEELVVWDGVVCRNQSNNIAESWMTDQTNTYDRSIAEAINYRRWLDIKSCLKLNNCMTETKRGTVNYDPTQKYRLVWDALTHNMNLIILRAGKDTTADETTWPNSSYADVHSRFTNKKTDKGGQHVMLLDARRRYVYAYIARHKFYQQEKGWTSTGPAEVKRLIEVINPLIKGNPKDVGDSRRQIFDGPPHITLDNFFSGDQVLQYLGERGYQATMTCRRDRLPNLGRGKLDKIFFNHVSGRTVDHRSKVARFEQPIVAVKHVPANPETGMKKYTLTHCTFQSTGGTNISGVNALLELGLYVRERNRGRGDNKRRWAIEMNEARDTYLKTYSAVDKIDQTLLNYNINYRSWKWWHAPMRHAKAIAMSMAYHLYVQCCEGGVDPEWKMKPVASTRFKQELSSQMVQYKAWNKKYPGDEMMRGATQRNKNKRGGADTNEEVVSLVRCNDREIRVSYEQYEKEKKQVRNGKKPRLCSDNLELLKEHIQSMTKVHPAACAYCGKRTVMKCGICDVHLCIKEGTSITTMSCPFDFHNDRLYGLGYKDRKELFCGSKNAKRFNKPGVNEIKGNSAHMKDLIERYNRENK